MKPVALVFLAIITLAALACTGGQPTQAPISTPTTAPTVEATVIVATEVRATSEAPAPTGTKAVDLSKATRTTEPAGVPAPTLTAALVATPTPAPPPTVTPVPTPTAELVSTATPRPTAIPTPIPTPTPTPTPTLAPPPTPEPETGIISTSPQGIIISVARFLFVENNVLSFRRGDATLRATYSDGNVGPGALSLRRKAGPRFIKITPEQLPPGSIIRLYSSLMDGDEVVSTVLLEGDALPAYTPTPTPTPTPPATQTPRPTRTPLPPPRPALPTVAGYSPLLAQAASNLPAKYDFVRDGLNAEEKNVLDWADSRLFSNPAFLASKWGPDKWPYTHSQELQSRYEKAMRSRGFQNAYSSEDAALAAQVKLASAQAVVLLMLEVDIQKEHNGHHVVSWEVDSLDRVLDDLGIYPGMCTHCYGKSGYGTVDGIGDNYVPVMWSQEHVHREMLKTFAYLAKADGEGILVRSLIENGPDDFELLYKRRVDRYPSTIGVGSFAYENISFMSQIRLPDGTLVSYPTMVFKMVGDARTEREAVERLYDYMRFRMRHFTGASDVLVNIHRPHTVTPYSPELGWIVYTGQAGSPTSSGVITGALRALGLKAEHFRSPKNVRRAGSVEVGGRTYYYNGNDFLGAASGHITTPVCGFFRTLEQVENHEYSRDCAPSTRLPWYGKASTEDETSSSDRDVLVALYRAMGGEGWTDNDNWLSDRPISEWFGVSTYNGRVTHLRLGELAGRIPSELSELEYLVELKLSGNRITGGIPPELGKLRNLRLLTIHGSQLTGEIPAELGNLSNLAFLNIADHSMTGEIPAELGRLSNLAYLSLGGNQLTGRIPESLGNITYLWLLSLRDNRLTGEIPPEFNKLRNLEFMLLQNNRLTGEIPKELSSLIRVNGLREVRLQDNQFTGCIPAELEKLHGSVYYGRFPSGLPVCPD